MTEGTAKQQGKRVGWPELAIAGLFVASAVVSVVTASPLLQTLSVGIDKRIFPVAVGDDSPPYHLPEGLGSARVTLDSSTACIQIHASDMQGTTTACHPRLSCGERAQSFEVFRLADDTFYVETGSACDSACCDFRGMSFNGQGQRLDDTLLDRIYFRLGVPGALALLLGLLCLAWQGFRRRAGLLSRLGTVVGFGAAAGLLWWNMW